MPIVVRPIADAVGGILGRFWVAVLISCKKGSWIVAARAAVTGKSIA
jgi:hypothetical protein